MWPGKKAKCGLVSRPCNWGSGQVSTVHARLKFYGKRLVAKLSESISNLCGMAENSSYMHRGSVRV